MRVSLHVVRFDGEGPIGEVFGRVATAADDAGLAALSVMDHLWQIQMIGPPEDPMLEGYTALSYAAARTRRIRLGTLVTGVAYRHPGVLLKTVTSLNALSGGRAWLGIGAAWFEQEARGLGVPFPSLAQRFRRLEDTLQLAHRVRSGDDRPFTGRTFDAARPYYNPRADFPILIGGGGERKTLRLVAKYADACNLFASDLAAVRRKLDVLREHCAVEDRDYDDIEKTTYSGTIDLSPDGVSVEQAVDRFGAQADLGIDHVIVSLARPDDLDSMERLGEVAARLAPITPPSRRRPVPTRSLGGGNG